MKRNLDKSLVALIIAVALWLAFAVGIFVEFAFPRYEYTCETAIAGHGDPADGGTAYWVVLETNGGLFHVVKVSADNFYRIGPSLPVTVEAIKSHFLGLPMGYNLYIANKSQPHFNECANDGSNNRSPSGEIYPGGFLALRLSQ